MYNVIAYYFIKLLLRFFTARYTIIQLHSSVIDVRLRLYYYYCSRMVMVVVDIRHHHHHHHRHRRSGRIIITDTNIIYGHNNHRPSFAHRVLSFMLQATHAGLTREITHVLYM